MSFTLQYCYSFLTNSADFFIRAFIFRVESGPCSFSGQFQPVNVLRLVDVLKLRSLNGNLFQLHKDLMAEGSL